MSVSVMGYSPESSRDMSSDTSSPYPERPIRPLPKRRLRERLSPEVADSIQYPPTPKTTTPLFYHPYSVREELGVTAGELQHPSERERADEIERNYISRRNGDEVDSDEDETAYRTRIYSRGSTDPTGRTFRYVPKADPKYAHSKPPVSATSSVDGYDSFENTNNKKKRKIPTPGDSNLNGGHLPGEMAGLSSVEDVAEEPGNGPGSYSTGSVSSHGFSGPGRGRYGRIRNGRSPLRTLSDGSGSWGNGRNPKQRQQWSAPAETPGIISRSIANANAEKSPITPAQGQENVSLLQLQASKKPTPSTQFTFTCDSQVPGTIPWPGTSSANMHQSQGMSKLNSSTQTHPGNFPSTPTRQDLGTNPARRAPLGQQAPNGKQTQAPAPTKKNRRRTGREYLRAAQQRRQQQQFRNYHHPPAVEDIWICEFCEYERIFGSPPEALIKQYEMKDRRQRKQEQERRRLLEKAKMKGRKGKKGNKAVPKAAAATQDRTQHAATQQAPAMNHSQSQGTGTQSEEYYEDDYDEEYPHDDPPPPSPVAPQAAPRKRVATPLTGSFKPSFADEPTGGGKRIAT